MSAGAKHAFIERVRAALARDGSEPEPGSATQIGTSRESVAASARRVRAEMAERADELVNAVAASAAAAGWRVHLAGSPEDAADVVAEICRAAGIKRALRSDQDIFDTVPVDATLKALGVDLGLAVAGEGGPGALRRAAFDADAGITGADYAIAETGTVVLHPRKGLSRLVSLAPARHIAILKRGDVLPSLDELFTLERAALLDGTLEGSMNLISGPSRTGDIAATIVDGIHGPIEVHLVIVG